MIFKKFLSSALALGIFTFCFSYIGIKAVGGERNLPNPPIVPGFRFLYTATLDDRNNAENFARQRLVEGYAANVIYPNGLNDQNHFYVHVYEELPDATDYDAYMHELAEQF